MKFVFEKPYEFEGKEYKEIELDLDSLKGSDIAAVKQQFTTAGNFAAIPSADSEFCALLGARVANLPIEFFQQMPAKTYCKITQEISNFLLG